MKLEKEFTRPKPKKEELFRPSNELFRKRAADPNFRTSSPSKNDSKLDKPVKKTQRKEEMPRKPKEGQKSVVRKPLVEGSLYKFEDGHLIPVSAPESVTEEVTPKLVLVPDKYYKSFDGRKIKIAAINRGSEENPVVGVIQQGDEWVPRIWNEMGVCKRPYGSNNDILEEWSEG